MAEEPNGSRIGPVKIVEDQQEPTIGSRSIEKVHDGPIDEVSLSFGARDR